MVRAVKPRSASAPITMSSAISWLPMTTRSGIAALWPISVTRARLPASSAARARRSREIRRPARSWSPRPSPWRSGTRPARPSPATSATSTNSLRPSSEAMRTGTSASTMRAASGGSPARARITGATKAWKVKIAEVGKPGSTASGLPSTTARQSGLPGLSATPWTRMPGAPSLRHDAMREIARALRGAAARARPCRTLQARRARRVERRLVVRKSAERHRLAAGFRHRRRHDRAVAVIDLRRPERAARRDQLVAGREHRHLRPAHHLDLGDAAGGQHADLARADAACRAAAPARRARCRSPHRR